MERGRRRDLEGRVRAPAGRPARAGGRRLVVGGAFDQAGTLGVTGSIATWNGATWGELAGLTGVYTSELAVWDDGGRRKLVQAGSFDRPPLTTQVSVLDGSGGSRLGEAQQVRALHAVGSGPTAGLWIGGRFTSVAGEVASVGVARRMRGAAPVELSPRGGGWSAEGLRSAPALLGGYDADTGELVLRVRGRSSARARLLVGRSVTEGPRGGLLVEPVASVSLALEQGRAELRRELPSAALDHALFLQVLVEHSGKDLVASDVLAVTRGR